MSPFFPEGFALAGALIFGKRILPGIFIGQIFLALYNHSTLDFAIIISAGNTLEAFIAYKLFQYFKFNSNLHEVRDFFGLLFLIVFILQPISSLIGNSTLYFSGILPSTQFINSTFFWWIGNSLGQILLTPVLLLIYHNKEQIKLKYTIVVIVVTMALSYFFQIYLDVNNTSLLLILTLPATIYLATVNITYASISSMLLASTSLYFAQNNIGTFSCDSSVVYNILNINYFMASHIFLVLFVGILFKEKEDAIHSLESMAHYDYLTGLPNRHLLRQEIHNTAYLCHEKNKQSAICFIDLDGFKEVNDTYGHYIGDNVLKKIVEIVKPFTNAEDAFLRIGGDEFLIIFNSITSKEEIDEKLIKILLEVSKSMFIDGHKINISFSIGVSFCPEHGTTVQELMNASDNAMYKAKEEGKNRFVYA
jgi:diguanylate cyclase (GGDEF)-like protein